MYITLMYLCARSMQYIISITLYKSRGKEEGRTSIPMSPVTIAERGADVDPDESLANFTVL